MSMQQEILKTFRTAYAEHRRREGHQSLTLEALPYVKTGPLQKMWSVRAKSYEKAIQAIVGPHEHRMQRVLTVLDVGAGNGWLSYQLQKRGHRAIAIDFRSDDVDGLGVARPSTTRDDLHKVIADFAHQPIKTRQADICIFNASFHYATSVSLALVEAVRVTRSGGRIVIMDTPFYRRRRDGDEMVRDKKEQAHSRFGDLGADLTAIDFIEFLTPEMLETESIPLGITWLRHRVRYPMWYEVRPFVARLRKQRTPSRFDVWEGIVVD